MNFYKPLQSKIKEIPIIIYTCFDAEKAFSQVENGSIESHIAELYERHNQNFIEKIKYFIAIVWADNDNKMVDLWCFTDFENPKAGPGVGVITFKNLDIDTSPIVTAGDGLVVLGKEEESRRKIDSFEEYITNGRPVLPFDFSTSQEFYK